MKYYIFHTFFQIISVVYYVYFPRIPGDNTEIFVWFLLYCFVFLCLGFGENTNYPEHQLITFYMWILKCKSLILPASFSGFLCCITEYLVPSVLRSLWPLKVGPLDCKMLGTRCPVILCHIPEEVIPSPLLFSKLAKLFQYIIGTAHAQHGCQ